MSEVQKQDAGTIDNLAARINAEHRACETAVNAALVHAINAGEMLSEVKASLPHGAFGAWLKENFTGSDRTARAYMRVYAHREELEANRQSSATLSLGGALKALAPPKEEEAEPPEAPEGGEELDVSLVRSLQEDLLRFWSDQEREAFERILANPGPLERELLHELGVDEFVYLGRVVAADGFFFEEAAEEGHWLISYRSPLGKPAEAKQKIVNVPIPATEAVEADEDLAECIKRGCWQLGLSKVKAWLSIHNWFAKALAAEPQTDMDVWEKRVVWNADWRRLGPACEFLVEHTFHPETTERQWVRENNLKRGEFHEMLKLAEFLVADYAEGMWRGVTGKPGTKADKHKRWKSFEVTA